MCVCIGVPPLCGRHGPCFPRRPAGRKGRRGIWKYMGGRERKREISERGRETADCGLYAELGRGGTGVRRLKQHLYVRLLTSASLRCCVIIYFSLLSFLARSRASTIHALFNALPCAYVYSVSGTTGVVGILCRFEGFIEDSGRITRAHSGCWMLECTVWV